MMDDGYAQAVRASLEAFLLGGDLGPAIRSHADHLVIFHQWMMIGYPIDGGAGDHHKSLYTGRAGGFEQDARTIHIGCVDIVR